MINVFTKSKIAKKVGKVGKSKKISTESMLKGLPTGCPPLAHLPTFEAKSNITTTHKVIAIDFDGTLFEDAYPKIGKPILRNILEARTRQSNGDKIILWTCREGALLDEALDACKLQGLYFDGVNANDPEKVKQFGNDCRKIGADEYWDDKARTLVGNVINKCVHCDAEALVAMLDMRKDIGFCRFCGGPVEKLSNEEGGD